MILEGHKKKKKEMNPEPIRSARGPCDIVTTRPTSCQEAETPDSLAEREVGLVPRRHAPSFGGASFGVAWRRGRRAALLVPRRHARAAPCRFLIGAVVFISLLFHPCPFFGRARRLAFRLRDPRGEEGDCSRERSDSWEVKVSYLGNAGGTKPVSFRHLGDLGPQTVHVAAAVTAVTQQQAVVVVSLPTNLTSLKAGGGGGTFRPIYSTAA